MKEAKVPRGNEERRAIVAGRDIYAVAAPIVVEAAERILTGDIQVTGTAAPGKVLDAETFLRALSPEQFPWSGQIHLRDLPADVEIGIEQQFE